MRLISFLRAATTATLCTGAFIASTPAHAQEAYPLACMRGPNNYLNLQFGGAASYIFEAATAGGFQQFALQPGQCAWADRALNSSEPSQLWAEDDNARFLVRIMQRVRYDNIFVVWAYNDGSYLRVTRYDPE